ncbi:MAG: hypothetical protein Q7R47_03875 [Candidatus Diapherotrites archaeon]|nr:hypothetical protein [Candidatus Diapherotrites archaeon]
MNLQKIGAPAFIVGVIIAILASLVSGLDMVMVSAVLIVLGLIVGLLNVTDKEAVPFLVAGIGLILTKSAMSSLPPQLWVVSNIMSNIAIFVAPAVLIVGLTAIWKLAKN